MPGVKVFVDTNVLLYAHDRRDPQRRSASVQWLTALTEKRAACLNLQVLNELAHVLLRKKGFDSPETVFAIVDEFAEFGDTLVGWTEVGVARRVQATTAYSWWNCLLLASALELGCTHFLSEDLQDGHAIAGLTIVDPFAHTPEQILVSP